MLAGTLFASAGLFAQPGGTRPTYDLSKEKVVYTVGYAHLDTQWNWDYVTTIDKCLKNTMDENFYLLDKYPDYVFNFTGSRRYKMMKEYYPERYEKVKRYIRDGRWYVSGSSVDEGEVNVSSSESVIRQVLYGNRYFRQEFGKTSSDYMLPDCFGFIANLPTVWHHCGLLGFSTQKLLWHGAVILPFNVGIWNGPDGNGIIAALNPNAYISGIDADFNKKGSWVKRMNENVTERGIYFDFRYYGTGDQGGAPGEGDVKRVTAMARDKNGEFNVTLTASDQLFKDITPALRQKLPVYSGDLLLTEHSAGSQNSQAYMKRINRKNEILAQEAEMLAAMADYTNTIRYPFEKLNAAWELVLGSQMHDILPGTAIPKAYEYAWNDEFIAANSFAQVLENSAAALASRMNTRAKGKAILVYNPVAYEREDVVTAELAYAQAPGAVRVFDSDGKEVPSQVIGKEAHRIKILFLAKMPPAGLAVFDVRSAKQTIPMQSRLKAEANLLENDYYRVTITPDGDIAGIFDKKAGKELLEKPATLEFLKEDPPAFPAWNMYWKDRKNPPIGRLNEQASVRVVENGPVRMCIEVTRRGRNSSIRQRISLTAGEAGKRIEIGNLADWQSRGVSLKAAFPLTVSNSEATYNLGVGTIARPNNDSTRFEVPSREWFDLTDHDNSYGVTILEDCKYGSDKPSDNTLRLTLLYTPTTGRHFKEQDSQDWGMHEFRYGIYGHPGSWQEANSSLQGLCFNRPLLAFEVEKHPGAWGKSVSLLKTDNPGVTVMAFKKMEDGDYYIVRVNEAKGNDLQAVSIRFLNEIEDAYEVNGQEQRIGKANFAGNAVRFDLSHYTLKSFAVKLKPQANDTPFDQQPVKIPYNRDVFTFDTNRHDGDFQNGYSYPADLTLAEITSGGIRFALGDFELEEKNAVSCNGQEIALPEGNHTKLYLLAAADEDTEGIFAFGNDSCRIGIQKWRGYTGQHYNRIFAPDGHTVESLEKAYAKPGKIAWFASHCHFNYPSENVTYRYCYLYQYGLDIPKGARTLKLPDNKKIKIMAITVTGETGRTITPLQPLYDDFRDMQAVKIRTCAEPKPGKNKRNVQDEIRKPLTGLRMETRPVRR